MTSEPEQALYGYGVDRPEGIQQILKDANIRLDVENVRHTIDPRTQLLEHLHRYAHVEVNGEQMWVCRCGRPKPCQ
jgi:hypothetical protein